MDEHLAAHPAMTRAFPESPASCGKSSAHLITYVRDRPGHDRRYAINFGKAEREIGYKPAHDLEQGLRGTLDWYLENIRWWQPLLGRDYAAWMAQNYGR